jgi:hypothetical protein
MTIPMKKLVSFLILCLLIYYNQPKLIAQISTQNLSGKDALNERVNTITTAVPFLMVTPDSRAGGMGDMGVATSPDANSQHWNPAKYSFIDQDFGVSISYTPWLRALVDDIELLYLSGYRKFRGGNAIAASLRYFSLGNITFTDNVGSTLRDFKPNEFAFDVSYSLLFTDDFSGAVALRYIHSNLTGGISSGSSNSTAGNAVAGDISLFYTKDIKLGGKPSNMSYGLQVSNIGNKISYTDDSESNFLPTNMRIGGTLTHNFDEYNSLMVGVDFNKLLVPTPPATVGDTIIAGKDPNVSVTTGMWQSFGDAPGGSKEEFREITMSIGAEYWYNKRFALRAGYFHEHEVKGNRKFFTMGLGLKLNAFQLDFAYLLAKQNNPLENTLRFSLLFDFKGLKMKVP